MMPVNDPKNNATPAPTDPQNAEKTSQPTAPVNEHVREAHEQAEQDMEKDADLSIHSSNDDLDEGELARLGEDETGLI